MKDIFNTIYRKVINRLNENVSKEHEAVDIRIVGDYEEDIGRGLINNYSYVGLSSNNPSISTSNFELVWPLSKPYIWPTSEQQMEVVSDDANDAIGGSGANIILMTCLDRQFNEFQSIVIMNGTTPVLTTETNIFRINALQVISAGSSLKNEGNITVRTVGGAGNDYEYIEAGRGVGQAAKYTIPKNKNAHVKTITLSAESGKAVQYRYNFKSADLGLELSGGGSYVTSLVQIRTDIFFGEGIDLFIDAETVSGTASGGIAAFELLLSPIN